MVSCSTITRSAVRPPAIRIIDLTLSGHLSESCSIRRNNRAGGGATLNDIADTVAEFWQKWRPRVESLALVPPSQSRKVQPTFEIGRAVARRLGLQLCENAVVKVKPTAQMKNIDDWTVRQRVLAEAVQAGPGDVKTRAVLLFDDLIESGATLRRTADVLLESGAASVYALVLTRTK